MTTRDLVALASTLPTPTEKDGTLVRAYVTTTDDNRWTVCWGMDGARKKVHVGPAFDKPRDASALCKLLNERGEQATAVPA